MTHKFKKNQRFRIIINTVSFYTSKKEIDTGVGCFTKMNKAVHSALIALENCQDEAVGLCGLWDGYNIQIDRANVNE